MNRFTKLLAGAATTAIIAGTASAQDCAEPIKVGVLHSLSGTMAISETTLKDTMEMLVAAQNEKGGVLGCELEAVVAEHCVVEGKPRFATGLDFEVDDLSGLVREQV